MLRVNRARVAAGVKPLARSGELDAAAQTHSVDMVQHDYLDHTGSDRSEPQERAERSGYRVPAQSGWIVVEVISAISADPQGPVDWWLNDSPEVHGKVLLNPRWREIGVGYAEGGQYGHYWTALFGCRPGVLPSVTLDGVAYTHTEQCGDPNVAAVMATPTSVPTPTAVLTVTPAPTVTSLPIATPRLTIAKSEAVTAGRVVNVQWQGIESPSRTDWIGLYRSGEPDAAQVDWLYVGCAQIPLDARALGSCNLLLPTTLAAGVYDLRLFADNTYRRLAVTPPLRLP